MLWFETLTTLSPIDGLLHADGYLLNSPLAAPPHGAYSG